MKTTNASQISKEGLEVALALKPKMTKALGSHYKYSRNKPKEVSLQTTPKDSNNESCKTPYQ